MIKLLSRLTLFTLVCLILGEAFVRYFHLVIDVPQRTIDDDGIQRFIPGQTGYWNGGKLKWTTNDLGFAGCSSIDPNKETITLIGDSFIENFMNGDTCRQCYFMNGINDKFNFVEAGRAGICFLEGFMIASSFEQSLKPKLQILYMSNHDVWESIYENASYSDRMQYSIKNNQIMKASIRGGRAKKILYNWKLMYYLYNRFPLFVEAQNKGQAPVDTSAQKKSFWQPDALERADLFLKYIKEAHSKANYIVAFHPGTENALIRLAVKHNIPHFVLEKRGDKSITFETDDHWTCYGHHEMAKQVAEQIAIWQQYLMVE